MLLCFDHFLIYRRLKTIWWLIRRTARTDQAQAFFPLQGPSRVEELDDLVVECRRKKDNYMH